MDSGIESTENSNCSLSENPVIFDNRINYDRPPSPDVLNSSENYVISREHRENFMKNMDSTSCCPRNENIEADSHIKSKLEAQNIDDISIINLNESIPLTIPRPISEINYDEKPTVAVQIPDTLPLPEGSKLKLNFHNIVPVTYANHECPLSFKCLPPQTIASGPKSPLVDINLSGEYVPENYYGPLAILPYESRELQRKFRHYRRRLRQIKVITSMKPKEKRLQTAASLNNVDLVKSLLSEGVDPKSTDGRKRTPLHIAASKGYTDIVKLLLQCGADPNQKDVVGNTPLHLAACTSHIETVTCLLKAGTDVKQEDNSGFSPLHLANSRLKLMQKDINPSSVEVRKQVLQIIEMMEAYMQRSGDTENAEMLASLTNKLSLADPSQQGEADMKALFNSLHNLTLNKT